MSTSSRRNAAMMELTVFTKSGGLLTKHIRLAKDGTIVSDGSACTMQHGHARRMQAAGIADLAALVESLDSNQAIALGALLPDLPEEVEIITKHKLNGQPRAPGFVARLLLRHRSCRPRAGCIASPRRQVRDRHRKDAGARAAGHYCRLPPR